MEPEEILTEIRIPSPPFRSAGAYLKIERKVGDYAIAASAVNLSFDNGICASAGIGLTNVGPTPIRAIEAQNVLIGTDVSEEIILKAANLAAEVSQPIGDHRGSGEYKKSVVNTLTKRAIIKAKDRAQGGN